MLWYLFTRANKGQKIKTETEIERKEKNRPSPPPMCLGPTQPSPDQAHVGLVVYPKHLAVEYAEGDDRHHDADDLPEPTLASSARHAAPRLSSHRCFLPIAPR